MFSLKTPIDSRAAYEAPCSDILRAEFTSDVLATSTGEGSLDDYTYSEETLW